MKEKDKKCEPIAMGWMGRRVCFRAGYEVIFCKVVEDRGLVDGAHFVVVQREGGGGRYVMKTTELQTPEPRLVKRKRSSKR